MDNRRQRCNLTKPVSLDEYRERKERERLELKMRERYGSVEVELEAFLAVNREGHYETGEEER